MQFFPLPASAPSPESHQKAQLVRGALNLLGHLIVRERDETAVSRGLSSVPRKSKQVGTFPVAVGSVGTQRDILQSERKEMHIRSTSREGCREIPRTEAGKQKDQLLVNFKKRGRAGGRVPSEPSE